MSYPMPLTPDIMQKLMQSATLAALGLLSTAFDQVRVGWQQQGQPAWGIAEDVVILNAVEDDDDYNRVRDVENVVNDSKSLIQLTTYTRVWRVMWTLYGPNSFDRARVLRSAILNNGVLPPAISMHDQLALSNVYAVPDPSAPQRVPELFEKQWWERVDFSCQFNEQVQEAPVVPTVASIDVSVVTVEIDVQQ